MYSLRRGMGSACGDLYWGQVSSMLQQGWCDKSDVNGVCLTATPNPSPAQIQAAGAQLAAAHTLAIPAEPDDCAHDNPYIPGFVWSSSGGGVPGATQPSGPQPAAVFASQSDAQGYANNYTNATVSQQADGSWGVFLSSNSSLLPPSQSPTASPTPTPTVSTSNPVTQPSAAPEGNVMVSSAPSVPQDMTGAPWTTSTSSSGFSFSSIPTWGWVAAAAAVALFAFSSK